MTNHRRTAWLWVLGCMAGLTACNDDGAAPARSYVFAWVPKSTSNQIFQAGQDAAQVKARELPNVTVRIAGTEQVDDVAQAAIIDGLIADKVDGIIISVAGNQATPAALRRAKDAGVAIITFDSDVPADFKDARVTYFGWNDKQAGRIGGRMLMHLMGGTAYADAQGQTMALPPSPANGIAVMLGTPTATNMIARLAGLDEEIVAYNAAHGTAYYRIPEGELYCNDNEATAQSMIDAAATGFAGQLGGWFMAGSWGIRPAEWTPSLMPAYQAGAAQGRVKTVAVNARPQETRSMHAPLNVANPNGPLSHGLLGQKVYAWGYVTVQMLYDYLSRGQPLAADMTDTGIDIVCLNNYPVIEQFYTSGVFGPSIPSCGYVGLDLTDLVAQ